MSFVNIIFILYGLILLGGGFMGWKAGSKVSLIMGLISGLLVLFGVYYSGIRAVCGYGLMAITSGVLTVTFILRFLQTHKMMPSGMLLLVSLMVFILSLKVLLAK